MADLSFYVSPLSEEIREQGRAEGRAQGRAQGRAEGRTQGRAENILIVLAARGIEVTPTTRERIITCGDPDVLLQWLVRAATVAAADEIFDEGYDDETAVG
ncbi:hypothetical protein ACIRJR_13225 [Streptomyces sp. NPDC102402]|uniref:hypothetical protein n=1 Tax=Streptomyces sp. NPDC102402 TaxID=3366169 RepID=UPI0037F2BFEA